MSNSKHAHFTPKEFYQIGSEALTSHSPQIRKKRQPLEIFQLVVEIDPNKSDYSVLSIENSKFDNKLLAYTSWVLSAPNMLASLQLPFDKEYDLAQTMIKL